MEVNSNRGKSNYITKGEEKFGMLEDLGGWDVVGGSAVVWDGIGLEGGVRIWVALRLLVEFGLWRL